MKLRELRDRLTKILESAERRNVVMDVDAARYRVRKDIEYDIEGSAVIYKKGLPFKVTLELREKVK